MFETLFRDVCWRGTPQRISPPSTERAGSPLQQTERTAIRVLPKFVVRAIRPEEIDLTLPMLFDEKKLDRQVLHDQVRSFQKLARQENYDLARQMVLVQDSTIFAACCFVPSPGRTAFVFVSSLEQTEYENPLIRERAAQMQQELATWAFRDGSRLLQVLIDPEDTLRTQLCRDGGYQNLTDLIYLYGACTKSYETVSVTGNQRWETYTEQAHNHFKYVVSRTYEESLDCPELENLRDMNDVILGHKAAGDFDGCRRRRHPG